MDGCEGKFIQGGCEQVDVPGISSRRCQAFIHLGKDVFLANLIQDLFNFFLALHSPLFQAQQQAAVAGFEFRIQLVVIQAVQGIDLDIEIARFPQGAPQAADLVFKFPGFLFRQAGAKVLDASP